jgi:hypothetical protein
MGAAVAATMLPFMKPVQLPTYWVQSERRLVYVTPDYVRIMKEMLDNCDRKVNIPEETSKAFVQSFFFNKSIQDVCLPASGRKATV